MKTGNYLLIVCLFISANLLLTACDEDGDTTKPHINLISPAEGAHLKIGHESGIHFAAEFSDNEMLKSYRVEIHDNFDNHPHASMTKADETGSTVNFSFDDTWDLSGYKNKSVHHHEIKIPAHTTPGNYHMLVYCTDAAGNESYVARNIVLTHEDTDENDHDHHHD